MAIAYVRIERDILLRNDLNSTEKICAGLIQSFPEKGLLLSNSQIGGILGIRPNTVSKVLARLDRKGLIRYRYPRSRFRRIYPKRPAASQPDRADRPETANNPFDTTCAPVESTHATVHPDPHHCAGASTHNLKNPKEPHHPPAADVASNPIYHTVRRQFASEPVFARFAGACGGDVNLMQRYLGYAAAVPSVRNPVGLAVCLAEQNGLSGPPHDTQPTQPGCSYCDRPGLKRSSVEGKHVWFCQTHRRRFHALRDRCVAVTDALMRQTDAAPSPHKMNNNYPAIK